MYDELVKRLRTCPDYNDGCAKCPHEHDLGCRSTTMREAADTIEELNKPKWIPVTERLPETGVDVLVMFPHNMAVASRDMSEWVVNSGDGWCTNVNLSDDEKEPTHWMPLPSAPTEE